MTGNARRCTVPVRSSGDDKIENVNGENDYWKLSGDEVVNTMKYLSHWRHAAPSCQSVSFSQKPRKISLGRLHNLFTCVVFSTDNNLREYTWSFTQFTCSKKASRTRVRKPHIRQHLLNKSLVVTLAQSIRTQLFTRYTWVLPYESHRFGRWSSELFLLPYCSRSIVG